MGIKITIYRGLHWVFQNITPPWWHWVPPFGLIAFIVHRDILKEDNMHPAPLPSDEKPLKDNPKGRPDNGFGTDKEHPSASCQGAPFGRNCHVVPKHRRNADGDVDVQLIAQRLLARSGSFKPAADQLNIASASWIQMMVHGWVGHYDDTSPDGGVELKKGKPSGCPMQSFKFRKTLERETDGEYNSFRTMWWDSSFLYGNNKKHIDRARTMIGGKLKTNKEHPNTLPNNGDIDTTGDNQDSWLGVALLQELFLKEHNAIVEAIAKENPKLTDEELFGMGRNVLSAVVAKVHTIDWTLELLKTYTLEMGMLTNWFGLPMAFSKSLSFLPPIFRLIKKKADNGGVPFCLTEEFTSVYRLHPMLPPGLVYGPDRKKFIPLDRLVGNEARKVLRATPERVMEFWDSTLFYPCGHLVPHNYPVGLRNFAPTDGDGRNLPDNIDLAALDLYRDRERGVPRFNDFRRSIKLNPYTTWEALTGEKGDDTPLAKELEEVYGPAPHGIENCDLLVGDLYENKHRGFAISETSFIIFLLMASRRLDADPFLNEYYDVEHYSQVGLDWVENTAGMKDIIKRHYPELAAKIPANQSAFKPYGTKEEALSAWDKATKDGVVDARLQNIWADVQVENDKFFKKPTGKKVEKE